MGIDANVTSSQIVAAVTEGGVSVDVAGGSVSVDVSGGVGPTGPQGPSGSSSLPAGTEGHVLTYSSGEWKAAAPQTGVSSWNDLTGKPSTFTPSLHASSHGVNGTDAVTVAISQVSGLQTAIDGRAASDDSRLTDSREWSASTITQAEAEAGTATTRRAFTAERVRQAIAAWWAIGGPKTFTGDNSTSGSINGGIAFFTQLVFPDLSTAVKSNDSRLTDARSPTSHSHGSITNDGKLGTASGKYLKTTTGGAIAAADSVSGGDVLIIANSGEATLAANTPQAKFLQYLSAEDYAAAVSTISAAAASHGHGTGDITFAATDRLLGRSSTGGGAGQEITCTSAGRDLLDDDNAAAQRTTLGLGTAATANTGDFATAGHTHAQLHDRSHAITSSSDHTATAWRVFYSNGSGVVTELALGSSGTVLTSNGASAAPTFSTVSGGGGGGSSVGSDLYLWATFR